MTVPDLWPDDISDETEVVMPITILREQAAALTQRTRGIIEAEVRSSKPSVQSEGRIVHEFVLVAPTLDGYSYELFYIVHTMAGYPVEIYQDEHHWNTALDQERFVETLRKIFSDAKTKAAIHALIAQSKS